MSEDERENEDLPVDTSEQNLVKKNIRSQSTWLRLFFMLVVTFLYGVTRVVVAAVVVIQFFWVLFTADTNEELKQFGQQLAYYTYQIIRYLTFNTDERPFPFELEWPKDQSH
jgi:Flp pilus assembly protein TadB